jgi:phosphatidylinositol-3-phosphatase
MGHLLRTVALTLLVAMLVGCGGSNNSSSSSTNSGGNTGGSNTGGSNSGGGNTGGNGGSTGGSAAVQHVVIVILENQDYGAVVGNNTYMPFFNNLATQNGLATQFYANTHPSLGNYMVLTAGTNPTGNEDNWSGTWPGDNVVRQLTTAAKTWKVYAESLPSVGYTGGDTPDQYIRHHNPFVYFTDVLNSPAQLNNVVPFTQFTTDVASNTLPNYSFVVPNNSHNGHDCPTGGSTCPLSDQLTAIDKWLSSNIGPLMQNSAVMANTVVVVTFDESLTDSTKGGGKIATVFAGPLVKSGYQSTTTYNFDSLLRFSLESLGVTTFPNDAASAPGMNEFLK